MTKRIGSVAAAAALAVLTLASSSARPAHAVEGRTAATSGLFSLTPGHELIVRLSEFGTRRPYRAVVQVLDEDANELARAGGAMQLGRTLGLRYDGDRGPVALRVRVLMSHSPERQPEPILTVETMNRSTLDVLVNATGPVCAPGDSDDRGVVADCGGCGPYGRETAGRE